MNFDIDPDHAQLLESCSRFIRTELVPLMKPDSEWACADAVPEELARRVRRRSAELGFYAPDYPAEVGGQDLPQLGAALLRQRASSADCRLGELVTAGPEGPTGLLLTATPQQQNAYLAPLVRAEITRCLALTEPGAGSDTQAITTRAHRQGEGWVINGTKHFITNAATADIAIVLARTAEGTGGADGVTAFIVERGTHGFNVGRQIRGMCETDMQFEVTFTECWVPDSQVVGGPAGLGTAMYQALHYFALGRLAISATCLGLAARALRMGLEYAKIRSAFGRTISNYQYVQGHLVESHVELQAARLLTYEAAASFDAGRPAMVESSIAKLHSTETAFDVIDRMIQVFGGLGWTRELPLERMLRTVRMYRLVDGTSELQRVIVGRSLLGGSE